MLYAVLARIIHVGFYYNRRYAAPTGLPAGGQARRSIGQHTVSSMLLFLAAPRARLVWRLGGFGTSPRE